MNRRHVVWCVKYGIIPNYLSHHNEEIESGDDKCMVCMVCNVTSGLIVASKRQLLGLIILQEPSPFALCLKSSHLENIQQDAPTTRPRQRHNSGLVEQSGPAQMDLCR